jgi:hypothetical protein
MEQIKQALIQQFTKKINQLDLSENDTLLRLKYNTIVEDIYELLKIKKEKLLSKQNSELFYIDSLQQPAQNAMFVNRNLTQPNQHQETPIPDDFVLNDRLIDIAKQQGVIDMEQIRVIFDNFFYYYKAHQNKTATNWEYQWRLWLQTNKAKVHLIPMNLELKLDDEYLSIAKKYIKDHQQIPIIFTQFKNYYFSKGDKRVSWLKTWENWCINHKTYKPQEQSKQQKEKQNYRWDFRKAQESSDKIKNWLEHEKGINWLEDFYLKDIPIPGIGWQEVMHPDFNKEEILLYKIDSPNGQYLSNNKVDDIVDVEICYSNN